MTRLPDFIIIGAMKCATTTLYAQLANQAGIVMSQPKEPRFFSHDTIYARGIEWYSALFKQAGADMLCGESSTDYTKLPTYPHTVERMYHHLPDARLVYIMRHPIDRLISQYVHEWLVGNISVRNINKAIERHPELIAYSCYAMQLQPYWHRYGHQAILPVFFERLLCHPQQELERICRFLGYQGTPYWDNKIRSGISTSSGEILRKSPLRDRILQVPILRRIRRRFIPKGIRRWVQKIWKLEKRPQIDSDHMRRLTKIFGQDLTILNSWLHLDLNCENYMEKILRVTHNGHI